MLSSFEGPKGPSLKALEASQHVIGLQLNQLPGKKKNIFVVFLQNLMIINSTVFFMK